MEDSALCIYGRALLIARKNGGWSVGGSPCPDWEHAKAAAVVNIEHPFFEGLGFVTLLFGFLFQYLAVPHAKTIAEIRKELKAAQVREKFTKAKSEPAT